MSFLFYYFIFFGILTACQSIQLTAMFNETIFHELSWPIKLRLLKEFFEEEEKEVSAVPTPVMPSLRNHAFGGRRMPSIESLVAERRQEEDIGGRDPNEDDTNMRMKLFRLMYETVKDSDLKCKRAELIRNHYSNSSVFEIGYLMGDVMDKFNIMSDISMTLKRLFHEWKPIEHINAYEQISNQAIEINHLIDIMQTISKKNATASS